MADNIMSPLEKRLRERIRNTFSSQLEDMSPAEIRRFEDAVLSLISAYGAAQNGMKDAVYNRGVNKMRELLRRHAVADGRRSSSTAMY